MHDEDSEHLASLGYRQQLFREMGGFSNFAISFSTISVLTGAVLLFGYGLRFAGPVVNSIGWPLVSLLTLTVAASMAEIASAYPTAGGLYFWAWKLGGRGWSWITAWLNLTGCITIAAGINVAAAIYIVSAAARLSGISTDTVVPVLGALSGWKFTLAIMVVVTIPQIAINLLGIRIAARLNDFSVWWHIAGVALMIAVLAAIGRHHNSFAFLFQFIPSTNALDASSALVNGIQEPALTIGTRTIHSPLFALLPWLKSLYRSSPMGLLFVLSLLQAQWTYTGYDASAHVAEETRLARVSSAWGIFLSVAVSAVVGYAMLMMLTWCIPGGDVAAAAADPYPVLYIISGSAGRLAGDVIAVVIGVAMWLCGLASVTSMARVCYAFARDNGLPGSALLRRVNARGVPATALIVTSIASVLICIYAAAYSVVTSISTITLYAAYVLPVALNLRNRLRGRGEWMTREVAPWSLGRYGPFINAISIAWATIIAVMFVLPPNELVLWTMIAFFILLGLYWLLYARQHFLGPVREVS